MNIMTKEAVNVVINAVRNGANHMILHPLVRTFIFSDGVEDFCKAAGAFWFLDIVATEINPGYKRATGEDGTLGVIKFNVCGDSATISLSLDDDTPDACTRHVPYTDCPEGEYTFLIQYDGEVSSFILLSEY